VVTDCLVPAPATCYAPDLFRVAYGIQPLLNSGIDGRGETVTVLTGDEVPGSPTATPVPAGPTTTAGPHPLRNLEQATDIRQDLAAFDSEFRLPAAPIQVVNSLAHAASPSEAAAQAVSDVEIVHAVAPAATLRVVLLPVNAADSPAKATADMLAGLRLAVSGTDVAAIDWSLGEHFFTKAQAAQMHSILLGAEAHHVTVVAASGDNGGFSDTPFGETPVAEVSLPASDPLVLAVGGTTLTVNPATGGYLSETVWNGYGGFSESSGASGGGFSHLYGRPAYQDGVRGISAKRGVPDVAADAAQQYNMSIVMTAGTKAAITSASGTEAAAPLWAGLIALADQYAHHDLGFVNPAIYSIGRGSSYHSAFHDITTGSNIQTMPYPAGTAGYPARPGWDAATGWGSPNAQALVPLLARQAGP
jgi:subtilase family serine protease